MSHVCGFAIASKRRAQKRAHDKSWWLSLARTRIFHTAKQEGFNGTFEEWKATPKAYLRVTNYFGYTPFTEKQLKKDGWNVEDIVEQKLKWKAQAVASAQAYKDAQKRWLEERKAKSEAGQ